MPACQKESAPAEPGRPSAPPAMDALSPAGIPATLVLPRPYCDAMVAHVRQALPREGCGLLAGPPPRVAQVWPVTNRAPGEDRFIMDPAEVVAAFYAIMSAGWALLGVYHSHPHGPAWPSTSDVQRATYPDVAQIIVSLAEAEQPIIRAFAIRAGAIRTINLSIV